MAFTNPGAGNGCTVTHKLFSIDLVTNVETEITANGNVFTWNSATGLMTFSVTAGSATDLALRPSTTYAWKLQVLPDRAINPTTQGLSFSFSSTHNDRCLGNTVGVSPDQSQITYQIGGGSATTLTSTVSASQLLTDCPLTVQTVCLDDVSLSEKLITDTIWDPWRASYSFSQPTIILNVMYPAAAYNAAHPTKPTLTYQCRIEVSDPRSHPTSPPIVTDSFKVVIYDSCTTNTLTSGATNLGAIVYYIGTPVTQYTSSIAPAIAACPI